MPLTTEEFVRRAVQVHGDEYDYSNVRYIDSRTKICVICRKHGKFYPIPNNHLNGSKCKKCSYEIRGENRKCNLVQLIKRARAVHGNVYNYDKYIYSGIMNHGVIICNKHGDFLQTFNDHINNGAGCPKCALENRKINKSVAECFEIMKEWDFKKNNTVVPEKISYGSHKKVWWVCEEHGHSWIAMVRNRTIYQTGCPKCKIGLSRKNCVSFTHPHLIIEWDFSKNRLGPENYTYGSAEKVHWVCENGHKWIEVIKNRTTNNFGCPYCSGKRACEDNCLKTLFPELASEWDYEKNDLGPEDITAGSCRKIWWVCEVGHKWLASANSRTINKSGCPYCSGNKVSDLNSLATIRPDLLDEWNHKRNQISPSKISYGSKKKVWWICINGHEWCSRINNRTNDCGGCPHCSKRVSKSGKKWLDGLGVCEREKYINIKGKRLYVDGFDPETNTIYEYFGNYWHGNPDVYNSNDINPSVGISFGDLYEKTLEKISLVKSAGYNIIYKWGD